MCYGGGGWRRRLQAFLSAEVRFVLSGGGAAAGAGAAGVTHPVACPIGEGSEGAAAVSVQIGGGSLAGTGGVPLVEESFTARLRAKQLNSAGRMLSCRSHATGAVLEEQWGERH